MAAFLSSFKRSAKGNMWTRWTISNGIVLTVTVFYSERDGGFTYCYVDYTRTPRYSACTSSTEREAMEQAAWTVKDYEEASRTMKFEEVSA
jgi:hypothetical protein